MKTLDIWFNVKRDALWDLERVVKNKKVTFSDNMDEPVHRWFRFPAGFSVELVRETSQVGFVDTTTSINLNCNLDLAKTRIYKLLCNMKVEFRSTVSNLIFPEID